jgi:multiple sugar transport system permease protein
VSDTPRQRRLWTLGAVVVVILALFPVVWLLSLSLKPAEDLTNGQFLPLDGITFENYRAIFGSDQDFPRYLVNSLGIAAIATLISVVLAGLAAYALARLDFPGKTAVLSVALAIAFFPPISVVGPLFDMWRQIGLFDTWPGLIIPYMTFTLPLAMYTLTAFYREIPFDLEEAAQVDGATPFQAFRKVILPLAAPGTFTAAILVFIFAWNDFIFAITLTSTEASRTVPAGLAFFSGESQFTLPIGSIAAAAMVVTVPIVVLVLVFQRRIVAGLTSGAVKG